jgi:hypothetical protein
MPGDSTGGNPALRGIPLTLEVPVNSRLGEINPRFGGKIPDYVATGICPQPIDE